MDAEPGFVPLPTVPHWQAGDDDDDGARIGMVCGIMAVQMDGRTGRVERLWCVVHLVECFYIRGPKREGSQPGRRWDDARWEVGWVNPREP